MASTLKRSQRPPTTDSSALFYESQFFYNYASSSKTASPPPTYAPLSSYAARDERAQDPYRAISDDQRWLKRVRQQQQAARQQGGGRRSFDMARDQDLSDRPDEDEEDEYYEEEQSYIPLSAAMRRHSSNESRRSRTMSSSSASSSTHAFAPSPSSPTHPRIPSSPSTAMSALPPWQQIPAASAQYALPCYSPPDPSSPFTYTETLFEDEDESEDERHCSSIKGDSNKTRLGRLTTKFTSTRRGSVVESLSTLPSPCTKSSSASVHSVMSQESATDNTSSSSLKSSAKRQVDLITLRISLGVFHAKQRLHTRQT